jgi:hypothetical protein
VTHSNVIEVRSVLEEDAHIGADCPTCGQAWRLSHEHVTRTGGHWLDNLRYSCSTCGTVVGFVFDITTFFVPRPGVSWPRHTAPHLACRSVAGLPGVPIVTAAVAA